MSATGIVDRFGNADEAYLFVVSVIRLVSNFEDFERLFSSAYCRVCLRAPASVHDRQQNLPYHGFAQYLPRTINWQLAKAGLSLQELGMNTPKD